MSDDNESIQISQLPRVQVLTGNEIIPADQNGLTVGLLASQVAALAGGGSGGGVDWNTGIVNKPTTFPPAPHSHIIGNITGLQDALDAKAALSHTHAIADVTGLQTALNGKQATLVSGTNIKTINGESILGSGNISITGTGGLDAAGVRAVTLTGLDTTAPIEQPLALQSSNTLLTALSRLWAWIQWLFMLIGWMPKKYNIVRYGARGDGVNTPQRRADNKAAIEAAIEAALMAGSGDVLIPDGHYFTDLLDIRGASFDPDDETGDGLGWRGLRIIGESVPAIVFGTVGAIRLGAYGSVIESVATVGEGVFYCHPFINGTFPGFSGINLYIEDLDIRVPDNPAIAGIHAGNAFGLYVRNCQIGTGRYSTQGSLPTNPKGIGIVTPYNNNGAFTQVIGGSIYCMFEAVSAYEHFFSDYTNYTGNHIGIGFYEANHASLVVRACMQRNTYNVWAHGTHLVRIVQMNLEHASPSQTIPGQTDWQLLVADVYDPEDRLYGGAEYASVQGGVGRDSTFIKVGGANFKCTFIGAVQDADAPYTELTGSSWNLSTDGTKKTKELTANITLALTITDGQEGRLYLNGAGHDINIAGETFTTDVTDKTLIRVFNIAGDVFATAETISLPAPPVGTGNVSFTSLVNFAESASGSGIWQNSGFNLDNQYAVDASFPIATGVPFDYWMDCESSINENVFVGTNDSATAGPVKGPSGGAPIWNAYIVLYGGMIDTGGRNAGEATHSVGLTPAPGVKIGIRSTGSSFRGIYTTDGGVTVTQLPLITGGAYPSGNQYPCGACSVNTPRELQNPEVIL